MTVHKDDLTGVARLAHMGECRACRAEGWAEWDGPPSIVFGAVPGGTRGASISKDYSMQFHKDMYAYEKARKGGLDPEGVSVEQVERAEKIAYGVEQEHDIYFR